MKAKKILKISLIFVLTSLVILLSILLIVITKSISSVKDIDINLSSTNSSVCKILDNEGNLVNNNLSNQDTYTKFEDIPEDTINAFISIEDKKFYEHNGLNYLRIAKAFLNNIKAGSFVEGASTISQQLIKNKYLTNEKSIDRKIKEMYLTIKLESLESKEKILESYLNEIYYGNGAYGISQASHLFFNKTPQNLNLSESCVLAGLIKSPATYSPINNIENCKERRNLVLKEMYKDGYISKEEYDETINQEIILDIQKITKFNNLDLYSQKAINEASKILNISKYEILNKGYKIYTYQDKSKQQTLDNIMSCDEYFQKNEYGNIPDSLSLIMDNKTAGISAIAGRSEYDLSSFKRQPGSLIKPVLVYAPAYEEGLIYPCSQILDEKITIDNYTPNNVSNTFYGNISIRDAVAKSLNIPTVKLCNKIGIDNCKEYAEKSGLYFNKNDTGLAIALGGLTDGYTLEEITNSYIPFSNEGKFKKYAYVSKIISPNNITLYTNNLSEHEYCSSDTAYLMTENLIYASHNGTSKKLQNLNYQVASKTGTVNVKNSNLNTDAYSLAYTSEHTISVWLGNYSMDNKYNLNGNNNGGTFATQIVKDTLENIYKDNQPQDFKIPETIVKLPIDTISLKNENEVLLAYNVPEKYIRYDIFSSDNIPEKQSTNFTKIEPTILRVKENSSSVTLSFDTLEYLDYYLYKVENSKTKLLNKISSNNGLYTFTDTDIQYNTEYEYYVEIKSNFTNKSTKSNIVRTIINKDYNSLLEFSNNMSWIFS